MTQVPAYRSPLEETARLLCDFLPGIDRLVFVGGKGSYTKWTACEWIRNGNSYAKKPLEISGAVAEKLEETRRQKLGYQWISPDAIPFVVEQAQHYVRQLSLTDEEKYLTLVIRPGVSRDALSDILFLFFRNDKSNFGISHDDTPIDTSQKSIIGMLTANFAGIVYSGTVDYNSSFEYLKNEFLELLRFHASDKESSENRELEKWKTNWAKETLSEMSERDGINYVYQDDALKFLVQNNYPYRVLKKALEDAVKVAAVFAGNNTDQVFIEKYFIKFTDVTQEIKEDAGIAVDVLPPRMDKVYQFLERLENAARELLNKEQQPTSEMVGKAMVVPITAPAIRDFLKKNRNRVVKLLKQYPDKWQYIRRHFRPVQNILPRHDHFQGLNAG